MDPIPNGEQNLVFVFLRVSVMKEMDMEGELAWVQGAQ